MAPFQQQVDSLDTLQDMFDLVGDELNDVGIATEADAYAGENGPLCRHLDSCDRSIELSRGGAGHDRECGTGGGMSLSRPRPSPRTGAGSVQ